jgi:hypothetical protein
VLSFAPKFGFRGVVLAFGVSSPSTRLGDALTGDMELALDILSASVSNLLVAGVAILCVRVCVFVYNGCERKGTNMRLDC